MPPVAPGGHRSGMSSEQRRVLSDLGVASRAPARPSNPSSGNNAGKPPVAPPRKGGPSAPAPAKAAEDVVEIVRISQVGSGTSLGSAAPAPRGRAAAQPPQQPVISIPNTVGQKNFVPPRRPHSGIPRMTPQPNAQRQAPMQAFATPSQTPNGGTPVPGLQNQRRVTQPPGGRSSDIFNTNPSPSAQNNMQPINNGMGRPAQPGFSAYNANIASPPHATGRFAHTPLPGSGVGALMGGNNYNNMPNQNYNANTPSGSVPPAGDWQQQQRMEKQAKMAQQRAFLDEQTKDRQPNGANTGQPPRNGNPAGAMGGGMAGGMGGGMGSDPNSTIAVLQQQLAQLQMQQQQGGMGMGAAPMQTVNPNNFTSHYGGLAATVTPVPPAGSDLRSIRQRNMGSSVFGGTSHYPISAAPPQLSSPNSVGPYNNNNGNNYNNGGAGQYGMNGGQGNQFAGNAAPVSNTPVPPAGIPGEDPMRAAERAKRLAQQQALKEQIAEREREREREKREKQEEIDRERAAMGLPPVRRGNSLEMNPNGPNMNMSAGNGMNMQGPPMGMNMAPASPVRNPYQMNMNGNMGMGTPVNNMQMNNAPNNFNMSGGNNGYNQMNPGMVMNAPQYVEDYYNGGDNNYNQMPMQQQQRMPVMEDQYYQDEDAGNGAPQYAEPQGNARVREPSKTRAKNAAGADAKTGKTGVAKGDKDKNVKKGQFLGGRGGSRWDYIGIKDDGKAEERKPKPRVSEILKGKRGGNSGTGNQRGQGTGVGGGTLVGESELMYGYEDEEGYGGQNGYGYNNNGYGQGQMGQGMGGDPDLLSELPLYTGPGADNYNNGDYGYANEQYGYEYQNNPNGYSGNNNGYTADFSQYNQY